MVGGEGGPGDILTPTRALTVSLGWDGCLELPCGFTHAKRLSPGFGGMTCLRVSPAIKLCAPQGQSAVVFTYAAPGLGTVPSHADSAEQKRME